ncbi:MAG: hypothetical protein OEV49_14155 [candidate division Zixibacteria bacterium]|nr:hypothetical protein [candidate division Zixibacteria bacterium]MDH3937502.1 hypothetical protein [candidate division Zixibacteria bacterium]
MKRSAAIITLGLMLLLCAVGSLHAERCCHGMRGNIDWSPTDDPDIADLVYLVDYMFTGGLPPACFAEADVNWDGAIDIADLVYLVDYMFSGGPPPEFCVQGGLEDIILPLTVGNYWTTSVIEYNESGQTTAEYEATATVIRDTTIDDWVWHFMASDTGVTDTALWTNKEDGAWMWTDSTGQPQALMMKYPASAGESYPIYAVTVTVESISEVITVEAGTFVCNLYRAHIPVFGTVGKIWACPNIGVVRAEEYGLTLFGTYLSREVELLDFAVVVQ